MPLDHLFARGAIWFGGGVISTGGDDPCVVARDMDDALRIAADRLGADSLIRLMLNKMADHAS